MTEAQRKYLGILTKKADRTDADGLDARDAAIERLERELAEESEHAAGLRKRNDELAFQIEVLEQGYSRQLAEARRHTEAAERALEAEKARCAEIEQARDDALQALAEAEARIERLDAGADLMQSMRASPREPREPRDPGESMSIEALLAESENGSEPSAAATRSERDKQVESDLDGTIEEMISPDLVLARKE